MSSQTDGRRLASTLGTLGAAGVSYFALTFLAMHFIQPELNPLDHNGSDYAVGRLGWLMSLGFVVAGTGTLALAAGLYKSLLPGKGVRAAVLLLMLVALGFVGSGVFPTDVPLADGTVGYTFSGKMHAVSGFVLFLSLITVAFVLARVFARDANWQTTATITRWFAWFVPLGFVGAMTAAILHPPGTGGVAGLMQRIFLAPVFAWFILMGVRMRRIESALRGSTGRSAV